MQIAGNEAEQSITVSGYEKPHVQPGVFVDLGHPAEVRRQRPFAFDRVNEGADGTAVAVTELRPLRRAKFIATNIDRLAQGKPLLNLVD